MEIGSAELGEDLEFKPVLVPATPEQETMFSDIASGIEEFGVRWKFNNESATPTR